MTPKFKISNIVPKMTEGIVTAFYIWDSGEVESFHVPIQSATMQGLLQIGWDRQAWWDQREVKIAEIQAQLIDIQIEIPAEPEKVSE